jgi:hypothetical protein
VLRWNAGYAVPGGYEPRGWKLAGSSGADSPRCTLRAEGGKATPLIHQEAIGGYRECGMMMKAAPSAAFEVSQTEFLFQFFIIAFDDPALFRQSGQVAQSDLFRQIRQPVFARFGFPAGPLDQEPLLLSRLLEFVIAMRSADAHSGKARAQWTSRAFPPRHGLPCLCRQVQRQLPGRYRRQWPDGSGRARSPAWSEKQCRSESRPVACAGCRCPCLRQIQTAGDGQTGYSCSHRQADRYLAIILFPACPQSGVPDPQGGYPAGLSSVEWNTGAQRPDGISSLLPMPGVIDNPGRDGVGFCHRSQHIVVQTAEQKLIAPGSVGHHMVQRLVHVPDVLRSQPRRHRLDPACGLQAMVARCSGLDCIRVLGAVAHTKFACASKRRKSAFDPCY